MSDWQKINQLVADIKSGKTTAQEVVEKSLKLIEADEHNSTIETVKSRSLERARQIDAAISSKKEVGRLAGVPFIAKDNFLTYGSKTRAASKMLGEFEAPYQSTVIERLEAEGAILVAKANMDAFAHGSSTENSDFNPSLNPQDKSKVPGGSSGGSAVSVVLGLAPFALGTDTGGSIRLPASFTGAVGLKPTYGSVSRYGIVAMASSTDVAGPLTTNVEDASLVYDCMMGIDEKDSTTIERDEQDYAALQSPAKLKIGVINQHLNDDVDPQVKSAIEQAIKTLTSLGHEVGEVSIPELEHSIACYYTIVPAEIASNLAKFDGIRFGLSERSESYDSLADFYAKNRSTGFNQENKRRILIGNYVLSSGFYDAYYKKAQKIRTLIINGFNNAFSDYDLLIGPVAPSPAFAFGENEDPIKMYLTDIMTVPASLAGLPAISTPIKVQGLPIGLQICGNRKNDKLVLELAKQFEGAQT